jgi:hypothetical protein
MPCGGLMAQQVVQPMVLFLLLLDRRYRFLRHPRVLDMLGELGELSALRVLGEFGELGVLRVLGEFGLLDLAGVGRFRYGITGWILLTHNLILVV